MARPTIVFLHGLLMSPAIWDSARTRIGSALATLAPWQPAHGGEPALRQGATIGDWAEWLEGKLQMAGAGPIVLVGHSMGGMLTMEMVRRDPSRIVGLVLVGTRARPWSEAERPGVEGLAQSMEAGLTDETARQFGRFLIGARFLERNPAWLDTWTKQALEDDGPGMAGLMHALLGRVDPTSALRAAGRPTIVTHGGADVAIALDDARLMAADLGYVPLEIAEGAGHCPPLEAPDWFADACAGFFRAQGWLQ